MTSKNLLKAALLGLFVALIFGSCKKDIPEYSIPVEEHQKGDIHSLDIGVGEARAWYESKAMVGYRDSSETPELNALNVHPDWFAARAWWGHPGYRGFPGQHLRRLFHSVGK